MTLVYNKTCISTIIPKLHGEYLSKYRTQDTELLHIYFDQVSLRLPIIDICFALITYLLTVLPYNSVFF